MDRGNRRGGRLGRGGRGRGRVNASIASSAYSAPSVGHIPTPRQEEVNPQEPPQNVGQLPLMTPDDYRAYHRCYQLFDQAPPAPNQQVPSRMISPEKYEVYYDFYLRFGYPPPIGDDEEEERMNQSSPPAAPVTNLSKILKEVRMLGCKEFSGTADPLEAKSWVQKLERTFTDMKLSEETRLLIVVRLLEKEAYAWWETVEMRNPAGVSWELFTQEFHRQYFTAYDQQEAQNEFFRLRQNNFTVDEYLGKLRQLAAVLPAPMTDAQMCIKFEGGLSMYIRKQLGDVSRTDLNAMHMAAKRAERIQILEKGNQERAGKKKEQNSSSWNPSQKKRKFDDSRGKGKAKTNEGQANNSRPPKSNYSQSVAGPPRCDICGKNHRGDCNGYKPTCYKCGKVGHIRKDCRVKTPASNQQQGISGSQAQQQKNTGPAPSAGSNRMQTRVFAMTEEEAQENPDVIAGL